MTSFMLDPFALWLLAKSKQERMRLTSVEVKMFSRDPGRHLVWTLLGENMPGAQPGSPEAPERLDGTNRQGLRRSLTMPFGDGGPQPSARTEPVSARGQTGWASAC